MKLTKKECREIAEKITNKELKQMFESAKNNITDWTIISNTKYGNRLTTKGTAWNILAKDFDVKYEYSDLEKFNMIREFGQYIPAHLKSYKEFKKSEKKEKEIHHEDPVFENNSDNDESYYTECMKLLNKLLFLMHGPVCEICRQTFENESWLMPIHILSKGAFKRLQFILKNVIWGCHECHKSYDEGRGAKRYIIMDKMEFIKSDVHLIGNLKLLYKDTSLLKNQNVKENLKELIKEYE